MSNFDSKEINILDAYIKKFHQFVILIIGKPCTKKNLIAKELCLDLKLPLININDFIIENKFIEIEEDGNKFKLYDHPENYNWEKLNQKVDYVKKSGVIIYGNFIDKSKINFTIDFSYFINLNTTLCQKIYKEKKLIDYDDEVLNTYFTKILNPIYSDIKEKNIFNKFYNFKEDTNFENVYDELFDNLMEQIKIVLKNKK